MIVADTNTIAYLYLPTEHTEAAESVLKKDAQWLVPRLWRSELRNILALYMRKGLLELTTAYQIQGQAEKLLAGNEYELDSLSVLVLAEETGCSAYDCEFVALAQRFDIPLVTSDKKLLRAFPEQAIAPKAFVS
nr:type II toxin-antitoxin system VapC family toxin [uncultured Halomonas sp.]